MFSLLADDGKLNLTPLALFWCLHGSFLVVKLVASKPQAEFDAQLCLLELPALASWVVRRLFQSTGAATVAKTAQPSLSLIETPTSPAPFPKKLPTTTLLAVLLAFRRCED